MFRDNLFRYYQQTSWCWQYYDLYNAELTSVTGGAWAESYSILWAFDGHLSYGELWSGGVGSGSATVFSQGKFTLTVSGQLVETKLPWVRHDVNAGGGYSSSVG